MKRVGLLLLSLTCLGLLTATVAAQDKKLTIRSHHHSMFELVTSQGTVAVIDPHIIEVYYRDMKKIDADVLLITHPHTDHNQIVRVKDPRNVKTFEGVKKISRLRSTWNNLDEEKFKDLKISTVALYHDADNGRKRGIVSAFVIDVDGYRIAHLSDVGHVLTASQVRQFGRIDLLMVPVGGIYTVNGSEAKKIVEQLKPRYAILPMHYGTELYDYVLTPKEFLEGQKNVDKKKGNEVTFDVGAKAPKEPSVILLNWDDK